MILSKLDFEIGKLVEKYLLCVHTAQREFQVSYLPPGPSNKLVIILFSQVD